jgi:hypothetical protein
LNTQGGPKRNENAEVLDTSGRPIPHLYSAGELGGVIAFQYQGGGHMTECLTFGKIAGNNAARQKAPLPPLNYTAARSNIIYSIGQNNQSAAIPQEFSLGPNEYLGVGSGGMGGDITVKVRMEGSGIVAIEVLKHAETEGIGSPALNKLTGDMIRTQSANVDIVTGASLTSRAFIQAVNDALSKAR